MAMPAQESSPAVRTGPAWPAAAVRTTRPDDIPAAFPGLLAVALAQSPPPNLLGQCSGGNPVAATAGRAIAAGPTLPIPPLTGQDQARGGEATAVLPAQLPALLSEVPSAPETGTVGSASSGTCAAGAATPRPDLLGPADGDDPALADTTAAATAAGPTLPMPPLTGQDQASGSAATSVLPAQPPVLLSDVPSAPETVGSASSGTCAAGAATPQPDLLGPAGGDDPALAATTAAATAGGMIAAGPPAMAMPSTFRNQASDGAATVAASAFQISIAVLPARPPVLLSEVPSAPETETVGNAGNGPCATGAATPQPNLLGPALAAPSAAATSGGMTAAVPPALAAPSTVRNQASGGAATVAPSAPPTPAAAAPVQPATQAAPPPAQVTAAVVSPGSDTYSPGPMVPPPATAMPRQGLAEAWQAANLGLAASLAPMGQDSASPLPGSMSTGAAVPDAAGAGGQPGAAGALPATVSRQVTIQLLKHSGDATAPGGRLTLRLDPPQLGRVEVSFEPQGSRLLVTLTAQTPEAERALRSGAGELQHALAGAGGKWQDVQVKIEPASGRDEAPPEGNDGEDPGEQPSRRRQTRDDD